MAGLIDKDKTLDAFDYLIEQAQEKLDKAITGEDWSEAARQELWLSGLQQGRMIVEVADAIDTVTRTIPH